MKKLLVMSSLLLASAFTLQAQHQHDKEAPKSPRVTAKGTLAEISYGQPSKRDRVIFGELVPYGEVWRTGANMSTDITVYEDVLFGGKELKKGTYAVFTVPGPKEWTVILNSKAAQKGAAEYEENKEHNVLEVVAPVEKNKKSQEQFTISFDKNNMIFSWDMVKVPVSLKKK